MAKRKRKPVAPSASNRRDKLIPELQQFTVYLKRLRPDRPTRARFVLSISLSLLAECNADPELSLDEALWNAYSVFRAALLDVVVATAERTGLDAQRLLDGDEIEWRKLELKNVKQATGGGTAAAAAEQLTDTQQQVLDAIVNAGRPISGKQICDVTGGEETTLRRHVIPALKAKRGVKNLRGAGYYLPPM